MKTQIPNTTDALVKRLAQLPSEMAAASVIYSERQSEASEAQRLSRKALDRMNALHDEYNACTDRLVAIEAKRMTNNA